MNNVPNMLALKRQLLQDVIVLNQHPSMLQVVVVCFNFIVSILLFYRWLLSASIFCFIVFPFFSFAFVFIYGHYQHYQHYHDTDRRSSEVHGSPTS